MDYTTILKEGIIELNIEKSRFIGYAKPIQEEEEAIEYINNIKTIHSDATHNVYAYTLGENFNIQKFSDDGEPTSTAGLPILDIFKKQNITNIVIVVTRYFGGIKLGKGGLIRAYSNSAIEAINSAGKCDILDFLKVKIAFEYTLQGKIENFFRIEKIKYDNIEYTQNVSLNFYSRKEELDKIILKLNEISSGDLRLLDEENVQLKDSSNYKN